MCECSVCQYSRKLQANLEGLPPEQKAFFEDMYDILIHTEMDRGYYYAIIKNQWPGSDEVIQRYRDEKDNHG